MKQQILRELDETGLLVGDTLNEALLANDRAKYLLTLLQLAFDQARNPRVQPDDLSEERRAVELDDPVLDTVIPGATKTGSGSVELPALDRVREHLTTACRRMLEPIRQSRVPEAPQIEERLGRLIDRLLGDDAVPSEAWLDNLTRGVPGRGDTLHLYVMDAHRLINRVQRSLKRTYVEGAATIGVRDDDRDLVRAFVRGVSRTAALKLDHPGLDTTASRYAGRLVIQNDVGLTDSHVIVITVSETQVKVTYTDIHSRRLAFFRGMLDVLQPVWKEISTRSSEELEEGDRYYVLTGTINAATREIQEHVLEHIGSRLVFLIDWNKARKRLRTFLGNKLAVRVLDAAAKAEVGHMAFLKLGGEELIYQVLDVAAREHLRCGEPFQSAVGARVAEECFTETMVLCHEGLANGDSVQVIRDRIVSAITKGLTRKTPDLLEACRRLAALVVEAALTLQHIMRAARTGTDGGAFVERSHRRIEAWEGTGDEIVSRVRRREGRRPSGLPLRELSGAVDDALDEIDRAAYFLTRLRTEERDQKILEALDDMAGLLVRSAQEFYKAIAAVSESASLRSSEDLPDFFESIGRVDHLTKLKDTREREFLEDIFDSTDPPGHLQRLREIGSRISLAVESLAGAGFLLYDSVFNPGQIGT